MRQKIQLLKNSPNCLCVETHRTQFNQIFPHEFFGSVRFGCDCQEFFLVCRLLCLTFTNITIVRFELVPCMNMNIYARVCVNHENVICNCACLRACVVACFFSGPKYTIWIQTTSCIKIGLNKIRLCVSNKSVMYRCMYT